MKDIRRCLQRFTPIDVESEPTSPYFKRHENTPHVRNGKEVKALSAETGGDTDDLVEGATAGNADELLQAREMLNSRYEDLKSGRVKPVDGEKAIETIPNRSWLELDGRRSLFAVGALQRIIKLPKRIEG